MEKQNILHQNWVKSDLDRKSHFFDNDSCTSGTLSSPPVMSIGFISVVCTLGQYDVYLISCVPQVHLLVDIEKGTGRQVGGRHTEEYR